MKLTLILALTAAAAFAQGPLTPPATPAPTGKSLQEIYDKAEAADAKAEKRTPISAPGLINQPGSYYLTANLTGTTAILVISSNVTIDLNGFSVYGAINASSVERTTIRNGTVAPTTGVSGITGGRRTSISNVSVMRTGIQVGDFSTVTNCKVQRSEEGSGIDTGISSVVEGCAVDLLGDGSVIIGINMGVNALAKDCRVQGSSQTAHDGILIASGSVVDCGARYCRIGIGGTAVLGVTQGISVSNATVSYATLGIAGGRNSSVRNSTLAECVVTGVSLGDGSTADGLNVAGGSTGVSGGANCRISDCAVSGCSSGIYADSGSIITNCVASQNFVSGIQVWTGGSVKGCVARQNNDGIRVETSCEVIGCLLDQNGRGIFGVAVTGGTRLESNQFTDNTTAITLSAAGNTILKNAFRGNGFNISCPPGNDIAPASSAATATSPVANIVY